jgi:serpin B
MSTKRTALGWLTVAMMITSGSGCTGNTDESSADAPSALQTEAPSPELDTLVQNSNAFGIDLYLRLAAANEGNVFISPVSISSALAMTYAGARGRTQEQMASAMHLTLPESEVHPAFQALGSLLESRHIAPHEVPGEGKKSLHLDLVNTVWMQKGLSLLPGYIRTIATYYEGGLDTLDFAHDPEGARRFINLFVERNTEKRIQDLLPPGAVDTRTRLVLTNTVYFYGSWATPFEARNTHAGVFHARRGDVRVQMMHGEKFVPYAEGDGWQMFELPYDGRKLGMTILLPAAGRFTQIRDALTPAWLAQAVDQMHAHEHEGLTVSMPRFRFTYGTVALRAALSSMGMVDAFDPIRADFTGMVREPVLNLDNVYHKTFLAVDEYGTEAAGATGVVVTLGAVPETRLVEVDRPFIVLIRDTSGAVLFLGQVTDPPPEPQ